MKAKIHPKYYKEATITCACGNVFQVGSTVEKVEIEICSACHPFYTGKKKLVDSAGQVESFQKKMEIAKQYRKAQAKKGKKKTTAQNNKSVKKAKIKTKKTKK